MVAITAAVTRGKDAPFVFEQLELAEPRPDELLVKLTSSGLCHTDLAMVQGEIPAPFPIVLGHEGAGIVEEVGSAVTGFQLGDRVAVSFASCGHCSNCLSGKEAYCESFMALNFGGVREDGSTTITDGEGATVHGSFFGQSSFATHALVAARNAVKVPEGIDLDLTGPLGCGIQTGAGAVINTLGVTAGASIVISGTGAVGLAALMAAKAVGATTIIAVDVLAPRLETALELGATHVVNGREEDVVARVQEITGGGADYAFDTTGIPPVIVNDLLALKMGGEIGLVAAGPEGAAIPVSAMTGKTVRSLIEGDSVPQVFIPHLIALYQRGVFPFDRLVTKYPFADIDRAIADTQSGAAVKAVLTIA
ncbi:MAG TPA: NAD(P)-dependent alcohol dehydrogenase [Gryllotalpicola sp.]